MAAFDLAERVQTPVFVLSDTDMGMNHWMSDAFDYPDKPLDRGKVLTAADLERLGGFERYRDVDGDAIGWRTLPGTKHPKAAYFTRGSGHNDAAKYTEDPDEYQAVMDRLARKFENARKLVPAPVVVKDGTSKIGFLAYGSTDCALTESFDQINSATEWMRTICAYEPIRSPRAFTTLWPPTSAFMWSSRIATRSWPACSSSIFPAAR